MKEQSECGMLCPGWQKWHGMLCPGWQKWHGMFCPGDKNSMGCFVRGGISLWDVCPGWQKMAWNVLSPDVLSSSQLKYNTANEKKSDGIVLRKAHFLMRPKVEHILFFYDRVYVFVYCLSGKGRNYFWKGSTGPLVLFNPGQFHRPI